MTDEYPAEERVAHKLMDVVKVRLDWVHPKGKRIAFADCSGCGFETPLASLDIKTGLTRCLRCHKALCLIDIPPGAPTYDQ